MVEVPQIGDFVKWKNDTDQDRVLKLVRTDGARDTHGAYFQVGECMLPPYKQGGQYDHPSFENHAMADLVKVPAPTAG
jgi:hypothetical protein